MTETQMPDLASMRMLDAKEVKELVGNYSDNALDRLVAKGLFPKPVKILRKRLWLQAEVVAWQVAAVAKRNSEIEAKRIAKEREERERIERRPRHRTT